MKHTQIRTIFNACPVLLLLIVSHISYAEVPRYISYAGQIENNNQTMNETISIEFRIFDADNAESQQVPAALWTEAHLDVEVVDSKFTVELGTIKTLSNSVFEGERWLEIKINDEVLSPRSPVNSVPFSFRSQRANVAESMVGFTPSDYVQSASLSNPGELNIHWQNITNVPAHINDESSSSETPVSETQVQEWAQEVCIDSHQELAVALSEVPGAIYSDSQAVAAVQQTDNYVRNSGDIVSGTLEVQRLKVSDKIEGDLSMGKATADTIEVNGNVASSCLRREMYFQQLCMISAPTDVNHIASVSKATNSRITANTGNGMCSQYRGNNNTTDWSCLGFPYVYDYTDDNGDEIRDVRRNIWDCTSDMTQTEENYGWFDNRDCSGRMMVCCGR